MLDKGRVADEFPSMHGWPADREKFTNQTALHRSLLPVAPVADHLPAVFFSLIQPGSLKRKKCPHEDVARNSARIRVFLS